MADTFVPVQNPLTTDTKLDAEGPITVGANSVVRERMQIAGAAAAEIARVLNANPATSDYGVVTRPVGGTAGTPAGAVLTVQGVTSGTALTVQGPVVDNAAFTDGTTRVEPAGFIFDETAGTALTENDAGAARIDSKRAQVITLEDATTRGRRATVSASGALLVDNEELPAAAALSDALANPTTTLIGAAALVWGTTWERVRSASADGAAVAGYLAAVQHLYNGTSLDRARGNVDGTGLASAARTTSTNTADLTNHNGRGVTLWLDVSANPGAAETLSVKIQGKDPVSGQYIDVADFGVQFTAANGTKAMTIYPGLTSADSPSGHAVKSVTQPRVFRVAIVHSAAGSWTYSLGYSLLA